MKKYIRAITAIFIFAMLFSVVAKADSVPHIPYSSYDFNGYDESVTAPAGYQYTHAWSAKDLGLDTLFSEPQDMCVSNHHLFLLDSGNSRIVEIDLQTMNLEGIYENFVDDKGLVVDFTDAQGLAVDTDGNMYIADTENNRILICDKSGAVKQTILRPDEVLVDNEYPFRVKKLQIGRYGELYTIAEGIDLGIFVFDENGDFSAFVGSNPVLTTQEVLFSYFMRRFMTLEQLQTRIQATPLLVNNFCMDSMGFIYTVSSNAASITQEGMIRRLNYEGIDVLATGITYGDLEHSSDDLTGTKTSFSAVDVDADNFLYLLDSTRGRVFVYSQDGFLVSEFGARGDQKGCFGEPEDVVTYGERVYVLDSVKNVLHEFEQTDYVKTFFAATKAFSDREFDKALTLWQQARAMNTNSLYPYYGMALVYDSQGKYELAMENYRLAGKRTEYSNIFREYRKSWLQDNIWWVILIVAIIVAVLALAVAQYKKALACKDGTVFSASEQNQWLFPLYMLIHPIDGAEQFRHRNVHTIKTAAVIIFLWFAVSSMSFYLTGFIFNTNRQSEFNPAAIAVSTGGLYALFVISNWCVSTFLDGKGRLKEIACLVAYALLPYVFSILCQVGLSNILTGTESVFIGIVSTIGILWSLFILIMGMYSLHQYSFSKTLASLVLTIVGMVIIVFLIVMFYTLIRQGADFLMGLYQEATL